MKKYIKSSTSIKDYRDLATTYECMRDAVDLGRKHFDNSRNEKLSERYDEAIQRLSDVARIGTFDCERAIQTVLGIM